MHEVATMVLEKATDIATPIITDWLHLHAPEDTGKLVRTHVTHLLAMSGVTTGTPSTTLDIGDGPPYASIVAEWPPWQGKGGKIKQSVNWTKPGTKDHYQKALVDFIRENGARWHQQAFDLLRGTIKFEL